MMTSQVLRKLEARNLLVRLPDRIDTRARRLRLTRAGRDLVAEAVADVERADTDCFEPLTGRHEPLVDALATLARPSS